MEMSYLHIEALREAPLRHWMMRHDAEHAASTGHGLQGGWAEAMGLLAALGTKAWVDLLHGLLDHPTAPVDVDTVPARK